MDEARPGHRLNHGANRLLVAVDLADEAAQAVGVRWSRQLVELLALGREQANIESPATSI